MVTQFCETKLFLSCLPSILFKRAKFRQIGERLGDCWMMRGLKCTEEPAQVVIRVLSSMYFWERLTITRLKVKKKTCANFACPLILDLNHGLTRLDFISDLAFHNWINFYICEQNGTMKYEGIVAERGNHRSEQVGQPG